MPVTIVIIIGCVSTILAAILQPLMSHIFSNMQRDGVRTTVSRFRKSRSRNDLDVSRRGETTSSEEIQNCLAQINRKFHVLSAKVKTYHFGGKGRTLIMVDMLQSFVNVTQKHFIEFGKKIQTDGLTQTHEMCTILEDKCESIRSEWIEDCLYVLKLPSRIVTKICEDWYESKHHFLKATLSILARIELRIDAILNIKYLFTFMIIESAKYDLQDSDCEFNSIVYQGIRTSFMTSDGIKEEKCREYEMMAENVKSMGLITIMNMEGLYTNPTISLMFIDPHYEDVTGHTSADILSSSYRCMSNVDKHGANVIANQDLKVRMREGIKSMVLFYNKTNENTDIQTLVYCLPIYNKSADNRLDILGCGFSLITTSEIKRQDRDIFKRYIDEIVQNQFLFILSVSESLQITNAIISSKMKYQYLEQTIVNESINVFCQLENSSPILEKDSLYFEMTSSLFKNIHWYRQPDSTFRVVIS